MLRVRTSWLVACGAVLGVVSLSAQFRAGVDVVRLPVVVLDRAGQVVSGLTAQDFQVLENGQPQTITAFADGSSAERSQTGQDFQVNGQPRTTTAFADGSTGERSQAGALHLGLMIDRSQSMEQDQRAVATAAIKLIDALDEAVDITHVDFDSTIRIGRFTPASYPQLIERIRDRRSGRKTVLLDAVGRYALDSRDRDGLHVLVLYSDGGDFGSTTSRSELMELLRYGNVLVYVVGYLEHQSPSGRLQQQGLLTQIAAETGGEGYFPSSSKQIDGIYEKIVAQIKARYTLGYVSSDTRHDGRFRRIEVRVTRPDLKGLKVRTRSGYIAPN